MLRLERVNTDLTDIDIKAPGGHRKKKGKMYFYLFSMCGIHIRMYADGIRICSV